MKKTDYPNLADALATGRGIERAYKCDVHDGDNPVSASVNVLKNVWYCYVCGARGTTDGKNKAPSIEALRAMSEPETPPRIYPESYLDLFDVPERWRSEHYWAGRFPDWVIRYARLGQDPFSHDATFPVRTRNGDLAGLGRRVDDATVAAAKESGGNASRYRYPRGWAASSTLHGWPTTDRDEIVLLVEGMADWAACVEVGVLAFAHYGASLHNPQADLLKRLAPRLVLLGEDADEAGEKGALRTRQVLGSQIGFARVRWPGKDPGDSTPADRLEAILETVGASVYGSQYSRRALRTSFQRRVDALQEQQS